MEIEHGVKVPPVTEKWKRIVKGYTVLVQFTSIIVETYMSDCVVAINVNSNSNYTGKILPHSSIFHSLRYLFSYKRRKLFKHSGE